MAGIEQLLTGFRNPLSIDVSSSDYAVSGVYRGITVNGAGNISMDFTNGQTVTVYLESGIQYFFAGISQVNTSGTTATGIILWE